MNPTTVLQGPRRTCRIMKLVAARRILSGTQADAVHDVVEALAASKKTRFSPSIAAGKGDPVRDLGDVKLRSRWGLRNPRQRASPRAGGFGPRLTHPPTCPTSPSSAVVGYEFDMSVTVTNRGLNRSQPAKLRFGHYGHQDIPALDSGATTTIRSQIGEVSFGETTYGACIVEAPGETGVSNNCASRSVRYRQISQRQRATGGSRQMGWISDRHVGYPGSFARFEVGLSSRSLTVWAIIVPSSDLPRGLLRGHVPRSPEQEKNKRLSDDGF